MTNKNNKNEILINIDDLLGTNKKNKDSKKDGKSNNRGEILESNIEIIKPINIGDSLKLSNEENQKNNTTDTPSQKNEESVNIEINDNDLINQIMSSDNIVISKNVEDKIIEEVKKKEKTETKKMTKEELLDEKTVEKALLQFINVNGVDGLKKLFIKKVNDDIGSLEYHSDKYVNILSEHFKNLNDIQKNIEGVVDEALLKLDAFEKKEYDNPLLSKEEVLKLKIPKLEELRNKLNTLLIDQKIEVENHLKFFNDKGLLDDIFIGDDNFFETKSKNEEVDMNDEFDEEDKDKIVKNNDNISTLNKSNFFEKEDLNDKKEDISLNKEELDFNFSDDIEAPGMSNKNYSLGEEDEEGSDKEIDENASLSAILDDGFELTSSMEDMNLKPDLSYFKDDESSLLGGNESVDEDSFLSRKKDFSDFGDLELGLDISSEDEKDNSREADDFISNMDTRINQKVQDDGLLDKKESHEFESEKKEDIKPIEPAFDIESFLSTLQDNNSLPTIDVK